MSFIKMDRFELMAAQLPLHLLPECVEWCDDYYETVFIEEQWPVECSSLACSCCSDGYNIRIFKLCLDQLGLKITKMISEVWIKFSFDFLDTRGACSHSECVFSQSNRDKEMFVGSDLTGFKPAEP